MLDLEIDNASKFQSTHSRGVRLIQEGQHIETEAISIHALTRSATADRSQITRERVISIHALTRSATGPMCGGGGPMYISIHALTRSATAVHPV